VNSVAHEVILLGDDFRRRLPELALRAAALTGGVSSVSQSVDLYLYDCVAPSWTTRVSGNFGNQVGRGGVESLSAYRPSPEVFSEELQTRLGQRPSVPW